MWAEVPTAGEIEDKASVAGLLLKALPNGWLWRIAPFHRDEMIWRRLSESGFSRSISRQMNHVRRQDGR